MNATAEAEPDMAFAQAASPLLQEYASKLRGLSQDSLEFWRSARQATGLNELGGTVRDELLARFKFLKPPVEELVRQSSAVLNEGSLRGLEKVELWLRLAELEHALETAAQRIELIRAKK
jgi:hypothetical protein